MIRYEESERAFYEALEAEFVDEFEQDYLASRARTLRKAQPEPKLTWWQIAVAVLACVIVTVVVLVVLGPGI